MPLNIELFPFKTLIKQRYGLMFDGLGEANLQRAIHERLTTLSLNAAPDYLALIRQDQSEFNELVSLLTINETYFFRDPGQWTFLVERLIPKLLARHQPPIRILSFGCSTGEEPYSLILSLVEKYGAVTEQLFSILAVDIDHRALARAAGATYGAFSFRDFPDSLKVRYFTPTVNGLHLLDPQISKQVLFLQHNILTDPFPDELNPLDIVLYRNVSIYFDATTRHLIQQRIHSVLKTPGYLLTATTETLANDFGVFRLLEEEGQFYFAKEPDDPVPTLPVKRLHPSRRSRDTVSPPPGAVTAAAKPQAASPDAIKRLIRTKNHAAARQIIADLRQQHPDDLHLLILEGCVRLHQMDLSAAEALARLAVERNMWSTEALVLLGLIENHRNNKVEATRWFRQAIYSRHECWPAHYYLGELYRASGKPDLSTMEFRIALRQIDSTPDPDGGLDVPLDLPVGKIRSLCEYHITFGLMKR